MGTKENRLISGSMADKRWDNSIFVWLPTEKKSLHGMMANKTSALTAEEIIVIWHHLQAHGFHKGLDKLRLSSASFGMIIQIK
jgi:hypothetical protein